MEEMLRRQGEVVRWFQETKKKVAAGIMFTMWPLKRLTEFQIAINLPSDVQAWRSELSIKFRKTENFSLAADKESQKP